jgi:hypothetical protein
MVSSVPGSQIERSLPAATCVGSSVAGSDSVRIERSLRSVRPRYSGGIETLLTVAGSPSPGLLLPIQTVMACVGHATGEDTSSVAPLVSDEQWPALSTWVGSIRVPVQPK